MVLSDYPKTLDQITYEDIDMHNVLLDCLGNTSMVGITGNMYFSNGDDPDKMQQIERIQGKTQTSFTIMEILTFDMTTC